MLVMMVSSQIEGCFSLSNGGRILVCIIVMMVVIVVSRELIDRLMCWVIIMNIILVVMMVMEMVWMVRLKILCGVRNWLFVNMLKMRQRIMNVLIIFKSWVLSCNVVKRFCVVGFFGFDSVVLNIEVIFVWRLFVCVLGGLFLGKWLYWFFQCDGFGDLLGLFFGVLDDQLYGVGLLEIFWQRFVWEIQLVLIIVFKLFLVIGSGVRNLVVSFVLDGDVQVLVLLIVDILLLLVSVMVILLVVLLSLCVFFYIDMVWVFLVMWFRVVWLLF